MGIDKYGMISRYYMSSLVCYMFSKSPVTKPSLSTRYLPDAYNIWNWIDVNLFTAISSLSHYIFRS